MASDGNMTANNESDFITKRRVTVYFNPMASCLNTNTAYYEIRFKSPSISVGGIVTSKR
jgi:hypothetical protein